ncbi:MAG: exosortase B [Methylophilus sp.]
MNHSSQSNNITVQPWLYFWWPILIGIAALYLPTYYVLSTGAWSATNQAHGPIVVVVVLYLVWQNRAYLKPIEAEAFNMATDSYVENKKYSILAYFLFGFGLICYVLGRSQDILLLDVGSQIPVFAAILLLFCGTRGLKAMWFPLFFLFFMIPLPGFFIDALTLPMKTAVSYVAENILYLFQYPISRTGVMLQIGQYQLLVADACAGMHTLISLEALGLLYLNLVRHDSVFRNIFLALLIIPISFTANVIRVLVLILITYYFGDMAGQGFLHGFAGMVLFLVALLLIMVVDSILQRISKSRQVV